MIRKKRAILPTLLLVLAAIPFAILEGSTLAHSASVDVVKNSIAEGAPTESVRLITISTNDLIFNPVDQKLYASIPSSAGSTGNSIRTIDPRTGELGDPVFVGSEPTKLAAANDGQTLWVALDGAYAIRNYNMATQTPGAQVSLGWGDPTEGRFRVSEMAIAPDDPNILAVARLRSGVASPANGGVAIFNAGVQLPVTTSPNNDLSAYLAFSGSGSVLYGTGVFGSGGLRTIVVDPSGATLVNISSVSGAARIKFAGGWLFNSDGQKIDPVNRTVVATYSLAASPAFVPDMAAGRVYYVVKNAAVPGSWTVKAFDINTTDLVGSFNISNVAGNAFSLVRWGGNGLAFRTTLGQVYIIQTNLIPSQDPIPTPMPTSSPTPTPSPTPFATHYATVPIFSNGVVYNSSRQKLYVTVPSSMGPTGNSIATVDPVSLALENAVFIGSEPGKVVQTPDEQSLYVELAGARQIRRFDIATQTPGIQFPAGLSSFDGPLAVGSLDVAPDDPDILAVSRTSSSNAIFDNGVQLADATGSSYNVAFSSTSTTLYGAGRFNGLETMAVGPTGITGYFGTPSSGGVRAIKFANGLVYGNEGTVVDPATRNVVGTFVTGLSPSFTKFVVDVPNDRIFFLEESPSQIHAYDLNTFLPIGIIRTNIQGNPTDIKRFGTNGIAISCSNGRLMLIRSTLINPNEPVPAGSPTPTPTPTITPTPYPKSIQRAVQPNNMIVYNPVDRMLYASVPGNALNGTANSITRIDPVTAARVSAVPVGNEPNRLALSDDGTALYVSTNQPQSIRAFDTATQTPGIQFLTINDAAAVDLAVRPGSPGTLVAAYETGAVAIYDNGVQRPGVHDEDVGSIEFLGSPDFFYGYGTSSADELYKLRIDPNGLTEISSQRALFTGSGLMKAADGRLFTASGRVVDPATNTITGSFSLGSSANAIEVDPVSRRAFYAGAGLITVFDIDTYLKLGTITYPTGGTPTSIVRWGRDGLAVGVRVSFTNQYIEIIHSRLVGDSRNTFDYDGDSRTDLTIFRPSTGAWYLEKSGTGFQGVNFGASGDRLTPADYDGDGKTDVAVYRPSSGTWYLLNSATGTVSSRAFGVAEDLPAPGDYDGDGKADLTVFRPSQGTWYRQNSSNGSFFGMQFGANGDIPTVGDFDGDGKNDLGIWRPSNGDWYNIRSSNGSVFGERFGQTGDKIAPADYDGDGKTDIAIYRPSTGLWVVRNSATATYSYYVFGAPEDIPISGDYDGDGKADIGVWRPSDGTWYIQRSSNSQFIVFPWGQNGDRPTPAAFGN